MTKTKIIPRSRLVIPDTDTTDMDSVKSLKSRGRCDDVLLEARRCWDSLYQFRKDRERCIRYTYGDQWGDEIMRDNRRMTEKESIIEQGNVPLTNNLIRKLVRTVVGVYRNQNKIPSCTANDRDEQSLGDMMSVALQCNWKNNKLKELFARGFEEFLISGMAFQKEVWGWRDDDRGGKYDCWSYQPNLNYIFFDTAMSDVRGWDCSIIGELHDLTFSQLCSYFAHSAEDYAKLKNLYNQCCDHSYMRTYIDRNWRGRYENADFFIPYDNSLCRVIEVWRKEIKPRYRCHDYMTGEIYKIEVDEKPLYDAINNVRTNQGLEQGLTEADIPTIEMEWYMDTYWYYRYLTPMGDVLDEGETPFEHGSHPYSVKMYPFTNGEIHSFVADVIDQQRYVNRLISLNDKLIQSSAKGILLYPISLIPEGKTPEQIQREWTQPDAVMFYDDIANRTSGARPEQIANKLTKVGTEELLQLEMGLMEEITGVNGALQGKPGFSGQSASLYAQQTQNASTSILDLLESYDTFIVDNAVKKVKNMQQFYDEKRTMSIVGKRNAVTYDPQLCGDVDFDLNVSETTDSPAIRMLNNDLLTQLFQMGAIDVKKLLEFGNFPFSDALLEAIKHDEQAMANGEQPQGLSPDLQEQISQQGNRAAVKEAQWALMHPYEQKGVAQ